MSLNSPVDPALPNPLQIELHYDFLDSVSSAMKKCDTRKCNENDILECIKSANIDLPSGNTHDFIRDALFIAKLQLKRRDFTGTKKTLHDIAIDVSDYQATVMGVAFPPASRDWPRPTE